MQPPDTRRGAPGRTPLQTSAQRQFSTTSAFSLQRRIAHLHKLGERALHEFLIEIVTAHGIADDVERRLEDYARIDPGILRALGGDRFPQQPIYEVRP